MVYSSLFFKKLNISGQLERNSTKVAYKLVFQNHNQEAAYLPSFLQQSVLCDSGHMPYIQRFKCIKSYLHKHFVKSVQPTQYLKFCCNFYKHDAEQISQSFHLRSSFKSPRNLVSAVVKAFNTCHLFECLFGCQWTVPKRTFLHLNSLPGITIFKL